ncbi:MAG TPA: tRNA (adenosine(37)-N6)-dimethylallyltransferase MiaA [Candidatus Acidoferrales bacterium]|nr:tRNA (adenosine(37)-N6)-dimethylallyltransferase MiaA [Candidatus Acidoferrales bacterium]
MNAATPARLIVILGPTASGKSALAIELARRLGGEILVCDSTQVYRHFDIGTAKVPLREQSGIPHHLVDLVEPDEIFTAGDYRRQALLALDDLRRRSTLPILAAGTGLYLRALLEGLADAPTRSEELRDRLRRSAEKRGSTHLHKILARLDPASAARIAPRDSQKIIRAIEMRILAGKPVAEIFRASRATSPDDEHREVRINALEGYAITKIGLAPPRPALYARIDARVNEMLAAGWLDEVRTLVSRGIAPDAKPFQFIGYSDLRAHLEGRLSLDAAVANIQQSTRRFAKRQLTWFRREPHVHWLESFGDNPETAAAALRIPGGIPSL